MIEIDYKSDLPIYEQIIEQFKLNIMKDNFKEGDKVISVRKMAAMLDYLQPVSSPVSFI